MNKIKVEDIRKDYPKAVDKLKEWLRPLYFENSDSEIISQYGDNVVDIVITHSARTLYDFFDSLNLFISIFYDGIDWGYSVSSTEQVGDADSRVEAEQKAFMEAFKHLNNL
jgi:hypothetical protein